MTETVQLPPPTEGIAAYTYRGWTIVVFAAGNCIAIGSIFAPFATTAKALAWIDARKHP